MPVNQQLKYHLKCGTLLRVETALFASGVLALACSGVSLAVVGWLARRSLPVHLQAQVDRSQAMVEGLRHEWEMSQLQLAEHVERLGDLHDAVERKRRSIAGSASKLQIAEQGPTDSRQELRRRAGLLGEPSQVGG